MMIKNKKITSLEKEIVLFNQLVKVIRINNRINYLLALYCNILRFYYSLYFYNIIIICKLFVIGTYVKMSIRRLLCYEFINCISIIFKIFHCNVPTLIK